MNAFLPCVAVLFMASVPAARGQAALALEQRGNELMNRGEYVTAAADFAQIAHDYPSLPSIREILIREGYCYLQGGDYIRAIAKLQRSTPSVIPRYRGEALFYTALAQLAQADRTTDPQERKDRHIQGGQTISSLHVLMEKNLSSSVDLAQLTRYDKALVAYRGGDRGLRGNELKRLLTQFPPTHAPLAPVVY